MRFVCALVVISSLSAAFVFGGVGLMIAAGLSVFVPLLILRGSFVKDSFFAASFMMLSSVLRLYSLAVTAAPDLGVYGSAAFIVFCAAVSAWLSLGEQAALYAAVPVFFLTAVLALYTVIAAFPDPAPFPDVYHYGILSLSIGIICPISASIAIDVCSDIKRFDRVKGVCLGMAVFAAFIIFPSVRAELGFVSVPICVAQLALEFRATVGILTKWR